MSTGTEEAVNVFRWYGDIDRLIDATISSCYSRSWDENFITHTLLRALIGHTPKVTVVSPYPLGLPVRIAWDAFKLEKPLETAKGDVAVFVRTYASGQGKPFEGVGFFEAKKIDPKKKNKMSAIKSTNQLKVMMQGVPHHCVVIYDYEAWSWHQSLNALYDLRAFPHPWIPPGKRDTHCLAIPTNCLLALKKKGRAVYPFTSPFTTQLCMRYLQGFDLEYDEVSITRAKGFLGDALSPQFILVAHIGRDGTEPPDIDAQTLAPGYVRLTDLQNP